jgi:hypothetical protein
MPAPSDVRLNAGGSGQTQAQQSFAYHYFSIFLMYLLFTFHPHFQSRKTSPFSPSHRSSSPPSAPRENTNQDRGRNRDELKVSDTSHPIHHFHPNPINVHCISLSQCRVSQCRNDVRKRYGMAICNAWRGSVVFSEARGRAGGRFPLFFGFRGWRVGNRTF